MTTRSVRKILNPPNLYPPEHTPWINLTSAARSLLTSESRCCSRITSKPPITFTSMRDSESNNASTSHSLLMRLRTNDVQAWKRLSELYGPMVYGWCRAAGLKPEDAADATQNVFQSVFTGFMKFRKERPGDRFRGWLWTITRNRVNDYFRQEKDAPAGRGGSSAHLHTLQWPQNLMPEEQDPETMVTETAQLVRRALELVQAEFETRTW